MNKIILFLSISFFITNSMSQEKIVQTAGRTQLGEFAPKFAELNDDVLFGEARSARPQFGNRHLPDQPGHHRQFARFPSSVGKEERRYPYRDC